jgi:hypothetical protein
LLDIHGAFSFVCRGEGDVMTGHQDTPGLKLRRATLLEWEASLFGACFIAFGLGVIFAEMARDFSYPLILIGIASHGWGMYRIHRRNR